MHDTWTDQLSDYLDDELPPGERAAVDAHLAGCPECALALDDLRRVVDTARTLPPRPPARDLWHSVADRLAAAPADEPAPGTPSGAYASQALPFRPRLPRRISFTLPQLAAASLLLAAVSGGLMWTLGGSPTAPVHQTTAIADKTRPGAGSDADARRQIDLPPERPPIATVGFADAQYDAAVADLEKALDKGRSRLDPTTVTVVEQNLRIIDRAIAQARQALESDPANSYLSGHLVETRRKKLELLRRATALTTESD